MTQNTNLGLTQDEIELKQKRLILILVLVGFASMDLHIVTEVKRACLNFDCFLPASTSRLRLQFHRQNPSHHDVSWA